jgi:hypothetical protein
MVPSAQKVPIGGDGAEQSPVVEILQSYDLEPTVSVEVSVTPPFLTEFINWTY